MSNLYPSIDYMNVVDFDSRDSTLKLKSKADIVIVYKAKNEKGALQDFLEELEQTLGLSVKKLVSLNFDNNKLCYALIRAPRHVLAARAEKLNVLIPLQQPVDEEYSKLTSLWTQLKHYVSPSLESGFFKIPYSSRYEEIIAQSPGYSSSDELSSSRLRSMLIYDIIKDLDISAKLKEANPSDKSLDKDEYRGIRWLEDKGLIVDSFVLHSAQESKKLAKQLLSRRLMFKSLSITSLRNYFGEKVAISFAWRSAWLSNFLGLPMLFGMFLVLKACQFT